MLPTVAEQLGRHFSGLDYDAIPAAEIEKAKRLVLDYFGVAIAGSQTTSGAIARKFASECAGRPVATLIGSSDRSSAPDAAFANAICSHSIELDDVDALALFHFGPPVVSAALAAAERNQASGRDFIAAIVCGCEILARVSAACNFSLRNRGFHTTPVCGVFGASVAAGKLADLPPDFMISALGLAGAQASGLMEMYGPSMQKRFNPGPAARAGLTAAMMAEFGFTGAATIFEGQRGFCRAYSDHYDLSVLTDELGDDYHLDIEFKPYSCARPIHNAIDCAIGVRERLGKATQTIRGMTMRRHPDWANYHLNPAPTSYHEAQMSLPYSVAIALIDGTALPRQYETDRLNHSEVLRLAGMLVVEPDAGLPRGTSCHLSVETQDGAVIETQVDYPLGSGERPMSDTALEEKFHMLADPVTGSGNADRIVEAIREIETFDISGLMALTANQEAVRIQ
ncbi:MmgE/PrpD family protein [Devosia sp. YIM 151766]|uniref:MmgE/PrpD family protein n=1 Tax=Devosia sp. YIM 151766 TaxID=3017325 RepID=UPI00255C4905|nr:MmgE/PrpD family protein [Devosia sp. YIM 151766]WIY53172.1 MmgE/PrpD family protein [Devosia sp. YIM 151766]